MLAIFEKLFTVVLHWHLKVPVRFLKEKINVWERKMNKIVLFMTSMQADNSTNLSNDIRKQ
jgi:hypothetical protein